MSIPLETDQFSGPAASVQYPTEDSRELCSCSGDTVVPIIVPGLRIQLKVQYSHPYNKSDRGD
eukprot:2616396-Pyramimonas_sp.AAC.1